MRHLRIGEKRGRTLHPKTFNVPLRPRFQMFAIGIYFCAKVGVGHGSKAILGRLVGIRREKRFAIEEVDYVGQSNRSTRASHISHGTLPPRRAAKGWVKVVCDWPNAR